MTMMLILVMLFGGALTSLPIIQVPVSIASFYLAVPFLLLGVYACFHFQLGAFWEAVSEMPAIFPDGRNFQGLEYLTIHIQRVPIERIDVIGDNSDVRVALELAFQAEVRPGGQTSFVRNKFAIPTGEEATY